ncbi:MAG: RnfH family protein [Pseudomonadales bacterium]|nr:RnfH family protein [Pseudomonadales bacterium]
MAGEVAEIEVDVAYATPSRQLVIPVRLAAGSTVSDAIEQSGICREFPEIDPVSASVGIFSRKTTLRSTVNDGDRVEIYRPLVISPRDARQRRAKGT